MQRAVERRGIPTVSVTVARDITEHVKPPRALFVPFMMGHHFGVPFHRELQRRVILAALERLTAAQESGEIVSLPVTWSQARREGQQIAASVPLAPTGDHVSEGVSGNVTRKLC